MDGFPIGSTPPYDAFHHDQRPANSNRKKVKRPKSRVPEHDVDVSQSIKSESETGDNLGVQDYYTPTDRTDEPE